MKNNNKRVIIILVLIGVIVSLMLIDYSDINEKFGFPINVIDEPILVIVGVLLGYYLAKSKFINAIIKKK